MTKREKEMERMHILSTIVAYPDLSTRDVRDRVNQECQHDAFDSLPTVSPQGITGKLNALSLAGLVTAWNDLDVLRWRATNDGCAAWAKCDVAGLAALGREPKP